MIWTRRILFAVAALFVAGLAVVAGNVVPSLDWDRRHRIATEALPHFDPAAASDGLVQIDANGMTFRARIAGFANRGPNLVLLHGFPETSAMWIPLIDAAATAGYRVVAFDQRGYSPGARPDEIEDYRVPELARDVIAIADAVGFERFHLVGHDWGCVVGWSVAIRNPDRIRSWTGLSIPHPGALVANLRDELPVYIKIFTAPLVPEAMLAWNDFASLREGSYAHATPEQREEYLAVFAEPGALTGALDWYRAITSSLADSDSEAGPVEGVPTLFLWGTREAWVTDEALALQRALIDAPYRERELEAGHFLMQDRPDVVVDEVLRHLAAFSDTASGDASSRSGS